MYSTAQTEILDAALDQLTDVCEVINKYKPSNLTNLIDDLVARAMSVPTMDGIVGDDELLDSFITHTMATIEKDIKVIYSRVTLLSDIKVETELVELFSAGAKHFYGDGDISGVKRFYKANQHYLVFRLLEQLDVPRLQRIGIKGVARGGV